MSGERLHAFLTTLGLMLAIGLTLWVAAHLTRLLVRIEARGQAFDDDLAAQRDKGGAVIRPLVPPRPLTAELLVRAQSKHLAEEWAAWDGESS